MSTTENGWTDKYPHKADAGDEYYFVRRKDRSDVVIMGFSMGKAWLNGVSYEQSEMCSHFFLGPLRPEDFEQLAVLRKVVTELSNSFLPDLLTVIILLHGPPALA